MLISLGSIGSNARWILLRKKGNSCHRPVATDCSNVSGFASNCNSSETVELLKYLGVLRARGQHYIFCLFAVPATEQKRGFILIFLLGTRTRSPLWHVVSANSLISWLISKIAQPPVTSDTHVSSFFFPGRNCRVSLAGCEKMCVSLGFAERRPKTLSFGRPMPGGPSARKGAA